MPEEVRRRKLIAHTHNQRKWYFPTHAGNLESLNADCQNCQNRRNCQNCRMRENLQIARLPDFGNYQSPSILIPSCMTFISRVCAFAIFLGSCLLFLVEPLVAKQLVPLLGGSSAVWVTCLVFFQTALLLGYLLAHWLVTYLHARAQALVYTALLAAGLLVIVYNINPEIHADTTHPVWSVFRVLTALIGLPFLLLSAAGPLLQ